MKTRNLFSMLVLLLFTLGFVSCADENSTIEIADLTGTWFVTKPVLADEFVTSYTFKADMTCEVYTGSPLSNGVPHYLTYVISEDKKLITLYDEERKSTEQYHILKFTSDEMEWKNATPKDGNSDKQLRKYKEK